MAKRAPWSSSFYHRILAFMLLFSVLFYLPFAFFSYRISRKNIRKGIEDVNQLIYAQTNYQYSVNSQVSARICMEEFLSNTVQQYLYSPQISYHDVGRYLSSLNDTLLIHPSIDSIAIYNRVRNEWFSTSPTFVKEDLAAFLGEQRDIPPLKPILRKEMRQVGNLEISSYVFSYFMYQYAGPAQLGDSFVVVNENANWMVENVLSIHQIRDGLTSICLTSDGAIVYGNIGELQPQQLEKLTQDFWQHHVDVAESTIQSYVAKADSAKFLVSAIPLESPGCYLLMIRSYREVFADLVNLQREFAVVGGLFLLLGALLIRLLSRKIYSPVQQLVESVTTAAEDTSKKGEEAGPPPQNELDYLQRVIQSSSQLNHQLLSRWASFEPMMEQHQLRILANQSTPAAWDKLKRSVPDHWLVSIAPLHLRLVLVEIDEFADNKFDFAASDQLVLLFAVQNILQDTVGERYLLSYFYPSERRICLVVHRIGEEPDDFFALLQQWQHQVASHLDITVSVSYSRPTAEILQLDQLYAEAEEYLQYRYLLGAGKLLDEELCRFNLQNEQISYPPEYDERLLRTIQQKDLPQVKGALEDIEVMLHSLRFDHVSICLLALANKITIELSEMLRNHVLAIKLNHRQLYKQVVDSEFLADSMVILYEFIATALTGRLENSSESRDLLSVDLIIDFVQNNYHNKELSSHMIGDYLGLSNRYLMQQFRQHTNVTLTEYITKVRMHKAASLLRNTAKSVNQISEEVGIENVSYFYRLFRKFYGCTPREFTQSQYQQCSE